MAWWEASELCISHPDPYTFGVGRIHQTSGSFKRLWGRLAPFDWNFWNEEERCFFFFPKQYVKRINFKWSLRLLFVNVKFMRSCYCIWDTNEWCVNTLCCCLIHNCCRGLSLMSHSVITTWRSWWIILVCKMDFLPSYLNPLQTIVIPCLMLLLPWVKLQALVVVIFYLFL